MKIIRMNMNLNIRYIRFSPSLFAVANATTLALGLDPAGITNKQSDLHHHLVKFLENEKFTRMFPIVL